MADRLFDLPVNLQSCIPDVSALEVDFPAVLVSKVAENESWRKEVHRPATHTHKWWAQRLGSVFRGILVSATSSSENEAEAAYSSATRLSDLIVYDPFAGSGTTLVEAIKLGARAISRDINPVAVLVQRQAVLEWDESALQAAFALLEGTVKTQIDELYVTKSGEFVLYYFWVGVAECPECASPVELFSNHVFAKHAYPQRHRSAQATCPQCHDIVEVDALGDGSFSCINGHVSGPKGAVEGQYMTCPSGHRSKVIDALDGKPPKHRMYAKLVLNERGERVYLPVDEFDRHLYARAEALLAERQSDIVQPTGSLTDGYNTRQALRWGYKSWDQFFNARQLLALGLLGAAIRDLKVDADTREALAALFSGSLEFNNMFCSYKGEGTGAVRHMFSHHILKPERTPLEAHPWGAPQSSGSFSTLFRTRLRRAQEYKSQPHDTLLVGGKPVRSFELSEPLHTTVVETWAEFDESPGSSYVAVGDSAHTDIPDGSVDLIVTDPPFMDNVHYSELADFFHAWLKAIHPYPSYPREAHSTRRTGEVQSTSAVEFERAIAAVWVDAARVLKDDGLMAFTFHHSKSTGWLAVMRALSTAGLKVTAVQPIKAEMSVSVTKVGAAAPSNLDSIVVCRKANGTASPSSSAALATQAAVRLERLRDAGIRVGPTDVLSVVRGSVLALLTHDLESGEERLLEEADAWAAVIAAQLGGESGAEGEVSPPSKLKLGI